MSGFKTPKAVVFGPIPRTSTGKNQKFVLRNQFGEGDFGLSVSVRHVTKAGASFSPEIAGDYSASVEIG